ncbi:hypothetical protein Dsin_014416 [Dipteronia sinensis]|uniref:Uncharacterized protein n=1 Tax=Dipteronia sinensis TaxID=43782 RepID=A0AAE0E9X1_9ROSI|nr:hypothetical protein Dsin_014416 [Dipteronia sinensis]
MEYLLYLTLISENASICLCFSSASCLAFFSAIILFWASKSARSRATFSASLDVLAFSLSNSNKANADSSAYLASSNFLASSFLHC